MSIRITDFSSAQNITLARKCLELIRDIAARAVSAEDPRHLSCALQDLTEVLTTGIEERRVEEFPISVIADLEDLFKGLDTWRADSAYCTRHVNAAGSFRVSRRAICREL